MVNSTDLVEVTKNMTFNTGNSDGFLTAGTLKVAGNFKQINGDGYCFYATNTHTVILNGTQEQSVQFDAPNYSRFANLEILNKLAKPFSLDSLTKTYQIQNLQILESVYNENYKDLNETLSIGSLTFLTLDDLNTSKTIDNYTVTYCKNNPTQCGMSAPAMDEVSITDIQQLDSGWSLIGSTSAINNLSIFKDTKTVWIYKDLQWSIYSPDLSTQATIQSTNLDMFDSIPAKRGIWVYK